MLDKIFFKQWRAKLTRLSPARRIFLSFALVILMGSFLLSLPFVQLASSKAGYIDHLFTAVSMVCVTGLFTQSVASTYNGWGQLICMLLIQIGGLGILTFIGLFFMKVAKNLVTRTGRPFGTVLVLAITRAWPVLSVLSLLPPLPSKDWGPCSS